ncbi:putative disease resistance protein RGA1 [Lolium rigidum]|uniref:putative disease resistance protein RGA1 n=1 Tax=Lolium rigidum TaxID=89674 RepID=UPI001F5C984C|nr:putative disease resistance protein RGA1 [Lolium rigidum]
MDNTTLNRSQHTSGAALQFKFEMLKRITNSFSEDCIIGSGAYGVVYKGVLDNGVKIAVKKLIYKPPDHDSKKQFHNECTNLMRVQHHNIVRLVGYCYETYHQLVEYGGNYVFAEQNKRALCFEYLEGGSLDKHISDEPCRLDWDVCYKIIKGVCVGLDHLHNGYKESIFHLDLKSANILLDKNMMPKIGDFGLSRFFSTIETCTTTTPLGTMGYTPPEYVNKQEVSPKYDVFSLGVVIIHIMAGRKHYYDYVDTPSKIIELVCESWGKRLHATMWSQASQEVKTCIEIALRCVKSDRQERPTIRNIVDDLNRIDIAKLPLTYEATSLQSREALDYNRYTTSVLMGVHDNATLLDSVEDIDYILEVPKVVGVNDRSMHDPHESISIMRDPASHAIGGNGSRAISQPRDVTHTTEVDIFDNGHRRRNPNLRAEGNIYTHVTMDTIGNLFQWARSTISSQWRGTQEKVFHDELFRLESGLQHLMDTLPAMYDLIDRAEWRSHKHRVAEYLAKLKDTVYDADDLLDEFRWYMLKVKVGGNGRQSPSMDFFNNVIQGSFTKLVNGIQDRLGNISSHLLNMGLHQVTIRFDKSVRLETSSFPDEPEIFGRDMELEMIIQFLCEPTNSSSAKPKSQKGNSTIDVSTRTSASNQVSNQSSIINLIVLPIVGIGGVGKTTLAQHICRHGRVESKFDLIIWVYVSDDFDVKRLTKEVIESCTRKQATTENLNSLQNVLSDIVSRKRFLIVLDDMWDDVLKENGQCWKRFCAPLKNALPESVMLVTTRSQKVADRVGTRGPIPLEGLEHDVFWDFFKLCVFESRSSGNDDPELEGIGRSIVPKLKGSPLAAKTLGRILRMNLQAEHWNDILESELWKLRQHETEILPVLRLSYMYLPFHLKRCFSFCAVYPKDYIFQKRYLVKIWVALGFVEPQVDIPVLDIGCQYFDDLLYRSFFQEVFDGYVIHDLLHDMAQKVSEGECFIVKGTSDFEKIPLNVRHLSILSSRDINYSHLLGLRHFKKLRTFLCDMHLANKETPASLMADWCGELLRLRVIVFVSTHELPASIGNLKHLRFLQISEDCPFKSLPAELYSLYNLQILCIKKCKLESLPTDFNKLICLQRFESHGFLCCSIFRRFQKEDFFYRVSVDADLGFRFIKNINQLRELWIYNISKPISKEEASEAQLHNKKYLEKLILKWPLLRDPEDIDIEVLRFLQPPTCLKSLFLLGYPGVSLPCWFQPQTLQSLASPSFISFDGLRRSSLPSITHLIIDGCNNLSCFEPFIHPSYIPALKKMRIRNCKKLVSISAERFEDFRCLEELEVQGCLNIKFQNLVAPSLKRLVLGKMNDWTYSDTCGNLTDNVDCCSVTYFLLSCFYLTSIQLQKWNLPALRELHILGCGSLTSIIGQSGQVIRGTGGVRAFPSLTSLTVDLCKQLPTIDDLLAEEYLPVIQRIHVKRCSKLVSLPGERFGKFSSLKELEISACRSLSWTMGFVLPSSLQILTLHDCGDISAWVPSCLQNLASLATLKISVCRDITSIPGNLWRTNLTSLENLRISDCEDIVSIGGENAISEIKNVCIDRCPKLEEIVQPMERQQRRIMSLEPAVFPYAW